MARCPSSECRSPNFAEFVDWFESFRLHVLNQSSSISNSLQASVEGLRSAPLRKCKACGRYGYVCPHCDRSVPLMSRSSDGRIVTCSRCHTEVMIRNPRHLFG